MRTLSTPSVSVSGVVEIDLSTAPDSDPDSIYNSATSSTLTLNKSGTGHDSPAVWNLAEFADGETALLRLQHGAPTGASKAWMGIGVQGATGTFVFGINAHGTNVAQPLEWNGSTINYVVLGTAEDTSILKLHRRGSTIEIRGQGMAIDIDGSAVTPGTATDTASTTGTVNLVAMVGINDTAGGTVAIPYAGHYAVLPALS